MLIKKVGVVLSSFAALSSGSALGQAIPRLNDAMKTLVDKGEFAGIATEVWRDGKLVERSAVGSSDLATKAPMTPRTIVRAFSMTKPITGVALMILHDQGRWDFNDPISKHLPELANPKVFKGMDASGKPELEAARSEPTMGQLVSHTAGYSYGFDPGWVDDQYRAADLWSSTSSDDFLGRVARIPLAYQPGSRWLYSLSMDLEGIIVERLSGMPLSEFMRKHIFAPLGMNDTGFHVEHSELSRVATVYQMEDGKLSPVPRLIFNNHPSTAEAFASGGGGLYTTADDYMLFARMLLGRGELDGRRIISAAAVAAIMTDRVSSDIAQGGYSIGVHEIRPGYEYGVNGVVVTDPKRAGVHLGKGAYLWDGLASTWFWVDPQHQIAFVGIVQRVAGPDVPPIQPISQRAVAETFFPATASAASDRTER